MPAIIQMGEFIVHDVEFYNFKPEAIHCMVYEKDLKELAVSRSNGLIEVWNLKNKPFLNKVICPSNGRSVESLLWIQKRLFSAGLNGDLTEYDLITLTAKKSLIVTSSAIWCLAKHKGRNLIAAGTEDGCIFIYEVTAEEINPLKNLDKQEARVLCLACHDKDPLLVSGSIDVIRVWNISTCHCIQHINVGRSEHNTETVIWCIALTSAHTIVSGDSRGKTCFWNGKNGSLIKEHQSHKADVLTLCVNEDETIAYSSGVEPVVISFGNVFDEVTRQNTWVLGLKYMQQTHDVRALVLAGNDLYSGGIDCHLVCFNFTSKPIQYLEISQKPLIQLLAQEKLLLFRFPQCLEIWKLGSTDVLNRGSVKHDGMVLPMIEKPAKILHVQNKSGHWIVCSAISEHFKWLAFSDLSGLKIYQIFMEQRLNALPKVNLNRLKVDEINKVKAQHMAFTADNQKLIVVTIKGNLKIYRLEKDTLSLLKTFQNKLPNSYISLLAVSSPTELAAIGYNCGNILIYNIVTLQQQFRLPCYSAPPTCLAFHPKSCFLTVCYSDQKILEFDVKHEILSPYAKKMFNKHPIQWLQMPVVMSGLIFLPGNDRLIVAFNNELILFLDKTKPLPDISVDLFSSNPQKSKNDPTNHAFLICKRYKHLFFAGATAQAMLVLAHCTPDSLLAQLQPAFKLKKFGT